MPFGDFADAGTVPNPLGIRRMARLVFGVSILWVLIVNLIDYEGFVTSDISDPGVLYWIAVDASWYYLSDMVAVGFSLSWGRWPQVTVFPFALALVVAGLVVYKSAWSTPLGWDVFAFSDLFFVALCVSLNLAAGLAVPG